MALPEENPGWLFELGLIDNISSLQPNWPENAFADPLTTALSSEFGDSLGTSDESKDSGSRKRVRGGACAASESKAFKEKLRRDKLNDRHAHSLYLFLLNMLMHGSVELFNLRVLYYPRFQELSDILEPGKPPKTDKAAILRYAMHMVIQLKEETQKLQESSKNLQEKVNELKAEKNELREEKQKLKAEKETLEQQVKALSSQCSFMPHTMAIPAPFPPQPQLNSKLVPIMSYTGMWQFMPQAAVDTSEDHVLRPPVA
ncbi:hypothetical protein Leryth_018029 [Lithospermum erythrorhizon]|nr:hypothetical protein Leryth_018029 [Lithospermum erythrorhizon]